MSHIEDSDIDSDISRNRSRIRKDKEGFMMVLKLFMFMAGIPDNKYRVLKSVEIH